MTRKTITLPIKCSTVHTISEQLDKLFAYEVILVIIAAAAFFTKMITWANQLKTQNLPINASDNAFFLFALSLFVMPFGIMFILQYSNFYIELIPKLECIKDVQP